MARLRDVETNGVLTWFGPGLLLVSGFLAIAWLDLQPKDGQPVAAVFPPWWSLTRSFTAAASANGSVLRSGAWAGVMVTVSTDPDFIAKLRAAGAWLVLDPGAFGACTASNERAS